MAAISKRMKKLAQAVDKTKQYSIQEGIEILHKNSSVKFKESIDVSVNLGVDPKKSDQVVRGSTILPNGTGKKIRVAVFAQGEQAKLALDAGAEKVGFEDLAQEIKNGDLNFEVVIATPDAMRVVGALGQILGPRGLMPNPKVGTVTTDVANAVKNAKAGQVRYRTDKAGIVHCAVGMIDFSVEALKTNIEALLNDLKRIKPSTAKGIYLKKLSISSTMGPGIPVDLSSLNIK